VPTTIGEGHAYSAVEATASGNSPDGVTLVLISFASIVLISFASIFYPKDQFCHSMCNGNFCVASMGQPWIHLCNTRN